jgi:hypothetical protein
MDDDLGRAADDEQVGFEGTRSIDCRTCVMQDTSACDDCVVTFICSRSADDAVVVDVDEWKAVRLLQDAGLVPKLRHRSRAG